MIHFDPIYMIKFWKFDELYHHSIWWSFKHEILDRHHEWRSLDPTLDICANFMKKSHLPPFLHPFKKDATFSIFFPFTSSVALVAMSQGIPKVTKGYQRLPNVTKGYQKLPKVTKHYSGQFVSINFPMDKSIIFFCSFRFDWPLH